ncbi:MAG: glycosyltransferase [Alphaproteobacteria bacterium]|nr:glycosyltransferase [Alphaproteobacteria bacterium]
MAEPFTFGIPLIARSAARNWSLVQALLELTLTSVHSQTAQDFHIVIAGHDRPDLPLDDARTTFIRADWPAEAVSADNLDSGRKKHAINELVLARGGGLLMFLDADDWIDVRLVAASRAMIGPDHVGGLIDTGFATEFRSLRRAAIPHPGIFEEEFHRICGSSTVARLAPDHPDPLRRDPCKVLHEHYRWIEVAREHRARLVRLPVCGNYVINTSENHSEVHGPFARWRRSFDEAVCREGDDIDETFAARFGLRLAQIRAVSASLFPRVQRSGSAREPPSFPHPQPAEG